MFRLQWIWMAAILAIAALAQASERPLAERRFDFRNRQFDNTQWQFPGVGTVRFCRPGAEGLLVGIPAGKGPDRVAFMPRAVLEGDFEITASFELLRVDKPTTGYGVGPGIHVVFASPGEDAATLSRLLRVEEGHVFGTHYAVNSPGPTKGRARHVKLSPATEQSGILRLVRSGDRLRYFVVDGQGEAFREIDTLPATKEPVEQILFIVNRHGSEARATVIWKDVTLRAEQIRSQEHRSQGMLLIVVLSVVADVLATTGVGYWLARKARTAPR